MEKEEIYILEREIVTKYKLSYRGSLIFPFFRDIYLPNGGATRPSVQFSGRIIVAQILNFFRLVRLYKKVEDIFLVSTRLFKGQEIYFTRLLDILKGQDFSTMTYTEDWTHNSRDVLVLNPLKLLFFSMSKLAELFFKLTLNDELAIRLKSKRVEYILWYYWWKMVVGKVKPKRVSFLTHYFWTPLIQVCHEMGVESIELQHGVIGPNVVTYCYDHINPDRIILPHKLLLLGSPWKDNIKMKSVSQVITGDYRLKFDLQKSSNSTLRKYDYYFISQPTIHSTLFSVVSFFSDFDWCICLHPVDKSNLSFLKCLDEMRIDYVQDWSSIVHDDADVIGSSSMLLLELSGKVKTVTQIIDIEAKYSALGSVDHFNKLIQTEDGWEFVSTDNQDLIEYFEELNYEELSKIYRSTTT